MNVKLKKCFLFFILFIILIISVQALGTYNNSGGNEKGYYQLGNGFFNELLTTSSIATRNLNAPLYVPLVNDLDNDGVNEIIVLDDDVIKLFHNSDLEIIDSYNLNSSGNHRFMIAYDIDGDNLTEIITSNSIGTRIITIIEYNGTSIFEQSNITLTGAVSNAEMELLIGCRDTNDCLFLYHNEFGNSIGMFAVGFNSTNNNTLITSINARVIEGGNEGTYCFPRIRNVVIDDYDNDNDDEYILSFIEMTERTGDDKGHIFFLDTNSTNVIVEQNIEITDIIEESGAPEFKCNEDINTPIKYITNPLVYNIDGSSSNGLETVIGFMKDDNEYEMRSYSSSGTEIDRYPEIFDADGELISNAFRTNVFTDTGEDDFCVIGYDATDGEMDALCASMVTSDVPQTREFLFDISNLYNVSSEYGLYNVISHSTEHDSSATDGNNLNEIVNSYGILEFDWNTVCRVQLGANIFCLNLIFENPRPDGVVLSLDIEQVGRDDLLVLDNTNLWYIDDGFVNQNAQIERYTTNPSILTTIKINQTPQITLTIIDEEGDLVQGRMQSYYQDSNLQDTNWTTLANSGTTFPFSFEANKTIGTGQIRFLARDENHNETVELIVFFSVNIQGHEVGDSSFDSGDLIEAEEEEAEGEGGTNQTATDNSLRLGIQGFSNDLNLTPTIILIVFCIGWFITGLVVGYKTDNIKLGLYMALGLCFLNILLFGYLQVIDTIVTVTLMFLIILFGIIFIISKFRNGE